MRGRAVIAGGGLAGLTCAKLLVDAGWAVTVVEGLPYLGGRASTYRDADGDQVEQGLHLFLGAYSEFKALLASIGEPYDLVLFWMEQLQLQDTEGPAEAVFIINPKRSLMKTPEPLRSEPLFADLADLPVAPAISVQLWLDHEVVTHECFVLVGRSEACVYQDQSRNAYPTSEGSRLSVIVSPADGLLFASDEALVLRVLDSLAKVVPEIRDAQVRKSVVLKHPKHQVQPLPGAMSRRPVQATPVPNLFLAGDWTQVRQHQTSVSIPHAGEHLRSGPLHQWRGQRPPHPPPRARRVLPPRAAGARFVRAMTRE
ncbi:FAD-dependent oxidoreductase [Pyxidicoccus caerfyrddinensis]|uniref:FAD-dependent oxidoreductase n=1 Tax=Pyxidicoccus caerfyrddinensis TaxID=2709663 RepID=UPI0013DB47C4|nr:FAD-dependent oxidoreductase [Pyxidicoccus caerfyrddinensis]